jgi:hypothetical protein
LSAIGGATSGDGIHAHAQATGAGIAAEAHGTGAGLALAGGSTAGDGLSVTITSGVLIDADVVNQIADVVLRRLMANVEASSYGDTPGLSSLYGLVQQMQESNLVDNAGMLTVYKTDGTTELGQKAVSTDAGAEPITGIERPPLPREMTDVRNERSGN